MHSNSTVLIFVIWMISIIWTLVAKGVQIIEVLHKILAVEKFGS